MKNTFSVIVPCGNCVIPEISVCHKNMYQQFYFISLTFFEIILFIFRNKVTFHNLSEIIIINSLHELIFQENIFLNGLETYGVRPFT